MTAIPGRTPPGQFAGLAGIRLDKGTFYAPIVGQVEHPPGTVVISGPGISRRIPFAELPVAIQAY